MNVPRPWKTRVKARLLTLVAAAAIVTVLIASAATWRADAWLYDRLTRSLSYPADERILLVAIDEKSLAELGRWPWSRRTHAGLVERLTAAGVNGVALNILLSEPALYDPEGDALLAQALNRSGKVVLPVYTQAAYPDGPAVELMPIPEFAGSAASLGHVDMPLDADGVPRNAFLRAGLGSAHWPALALALSQTGLEPIPNATLPGLRSAEQDPAQPAPLRWMRDYQVLVPYANPPDGYRKVSYADVFNGRVPPAMLRGQWILVGVTAPGMGGEIATPGRQPTEPRMAGVDYQANVLNMLLHGHAVVPLTLPAQVLLSIALLTLPLLLFGLKGLQHMWRPLALVSVLVPLVAFLLLRFADLWFPPVPALAVLGLGAVLLAARSLRRTRHQAQSDPLTRLANRSRFDAALDQELRSTRRSDQPLSVLLLDVDHFRQLNESQGQPVGDEVLRTLAGILRGRARRPRDLVARLGGGEFAVLLPETTPQSAAAIATTIHVDLANLCSPGDDKCPVSAFTASIGIHTVAAGSDVSAADVFERTDAALYQAKQAGRNRSFSHAENSFSGAG